jgi:acetoin utilization deacetylase AcuC-like enzyme
LIFSNLPLEFCGGSLFVENSVVIDVPLHHENCVWEIQTDKDYVLVFDLVQQDGNFEEAKEFLAV